MQQGSGIGIGMVEHWLQQVWLVKWSGGSCWDVVVSWCWAEVVEGRGKARGGEKTTAIPDSNGKRLKLVQVQAFSGTNFLPGSAPKGEEETVL